MAVQNHLLSNTILIRPDDSDDSDSSLQGETMKVQVNIPFNSPSFVLMESVCLSVGEKATHKMEQQGLDILLCSLQFYQYHFTVLCYLSVCYF